MHEFSIASEIVQAVLNTAEKNKGKRVLSVQLEIGEFTFLNRQQVLFWLNELFKGSAAEGAEIRLRIVRARISCQGCGYHGRAPSREGDLVRHFIQCCCPRCGSFRIRIEKGRECLLRKVRILK